MILVFGGTGTIGGAVLRQVAASGTPARAAVRSPERAGALTGPATETVVADLADPGTLAPALDGVGAVFLASPGSADQVELEGNLVTAAAEAGVPVVKLAALGYDAAPPEEAIRFGANHARVVQRLRDSGVPFTVLAPSGFMSNFLANAAGVRDGVLYGSAGDGGVAWIDPDDVGAVAAHVLTTDGHEGASYALTGPEVLTFAQVAERLAEVTGHDVRYVDVPGPDFEQSLRSAGLDEWTAAAVTELHQLYRTHASEVVTDEVQKATGRAPRSLADWLAANGEAFTG
ncbi:MAG: azoreductase [Modestobacter sp.]|jgi:uncharacterized protein YbjT (DUF2867 family)|nr:azoreductase [Modestobacter sp.]